MLLFNYMWCQNLGAFFCIYETKSNIFFILLGAALVPYLSDNGYNHLLAGVLGRGEIHWDLFTSRAVPGEMGTRRAGRVPATIYKGNGET